MKPLKTFVQGVIIGLGKIMPGVSGSVMAVCFGIYERIIAAFSSLKVLRKDYKFMGTLILGIAGSIVFGANVIKVLLANHYFKTMMFMIGMMIPGIFSIVKSIRKDSVTIKRVFICLLFLLFLIMLSNLGTTNQVSGREPYLHKFISLFLCGLLDAASTIIPGISGSALLMLLGYYEVIIASIANVFSFKSLVVLIPFFLGMGLGIVLTSKLITYLFKHHRDLTFMLIMVFASYSLIQITLNLIGLVGDVTFLAEYFIYTIIGFAITTVVEKVFA